MHEDAVTERGYINSNYVIYAGHPVLIVLCILAGYDGYDGLRSIIWK
jgi:hypothetical protein